MADGAGGLTNSSGAPLTERSLPQNIEAEQAVLGALLINNEVADRVSFLQPEHFFDPVHQRIYEQCLKRIAKNVLVTPVTLKTIMDADAGLQELGGTEYLQRLVDNAITIFHVKDYAQQVYDLALKRSLAEIGETLTGSAIDPRNDDEPSDLIVKTEETLYKLAESGKSESGFKSFRLAALESLQVASAAYQRDGGLAGVSSGMMDLDTKLGGFHRSDLIILAGRPSMGKTALVTNIAFNVAKAYQKGKKPDGSEGAVDGGVVGFFSLEMSAEQLASRVLSEQAEVPSEKIRRGDMDEEEFRRFAITAQQLQDAPLFIDDTPAMPISQVAARARRLKRQHGLDILIVDYLQLCRGSGRGSDANRVQEVSEITQGLKAIAKELDIPVIALSQLSRQVEARDDKRPQLSDLRESGSIEQDADVVMFVFREEYYVDRQQPREGTPEHLEWQQRMEEVHNLAEVIIGKQRHGPIGTVKLMFDGRYTRFGDLARDDSRRGYDG